ncbi:formate--tetrahydrofolate ligase [Lacticaseibacillus rhamnosus]
MKTKIETICREIYRADGVDYSPEAEAKIEQFTKLCFPLGGFFLQLIPGHG